MHSSFRYPPDFCWPLHEAFAACDRTDIVIRVALSAHFAASSRASLILAQSWHVAH